MTPFDRRRRPWLLLAMLLAAAGQLTACDLPAYECDRCYDNEDCESGRHCARFEDDVWRCVDEDTESCPSN